MFLSVQNIHNQCFGNREQKHLQQSSYKFDKEAGRLYKPFVDGSGKSYYIERRNVLYFIASFCAGHCPVAVHYFLCFGLHPASVSLNLKTF
jgi:hypothetical protein